MALEIYFYCILSYNSRFKAWKNEFNLLMKLWEFCFYTISGVSSIYLDICNSYLVKCLRQNLHFNCFRHRFSQLSHIIIITRLKVPDHILLFLFSNFLISFFLKEFFSLTDSYENFLDSTSNYKLFKLNLSLNLLLELYNVKLIFIYF